MLKFETTKIDLGIIEPGTTHNVAWKFTDGTPSDILSTGASCGSCTRDIVTLNNKVQAVFTEQDAARLIQSQAEVHYPDFLYPFTKNITVSIRNGNEPTLIPATPPAIGTVPNPKIPVIKLIFVGKVNLKSIWKTKN